MLKDTAKARIQFAGFAYFKYGTILDSKKEATPVTAVRQAAQAAKAASVRMAVVSAQTRDAALRRMADSLEAAQETLLAANAADLRAAEALPGPLQKRLVFDASKLKESVQGLRALADLPDPIGQTTLSTELAEGLRLYRVRCPIGVIGVVFESRPDALVQIAALCLKSGNASLLKGGREALETNRALFAVLNRAALESGLPQGWATLLETREDVTEMLALDEFIDLLIPRGSNAFVRHIIDHSRIPVMGHADGLCHVYVDRAADPDMALTITRDSKLQYVAVCNACETLLVHEAIAPAFLPRLAQALEDTKLLGCEKTRTQIPCEPATEADWDTEYLDRILSIRVVGSLEEAVEHINTHGSRHTDAIVTGDEAAAAEFLRKVDSAGVYWNCSTRFADGYRYGFGAEVGVATGKIHARGPMGLEGLTIYKYKLLGQGHTVQAFAKGERCFTHRPLNEECPL